MSGLYLPGYGWRSGEEIDIDRACKAHDNDLVFRRSERTGNYTIFQRLQRDSIYVKHADAIDMEDGDLFPVRAFPHRRMPGVDEVRKWLYESDRERGDLLEKVTRHNNKIRAQQDAVLKEEASKRAEFLEHGLRALGNDTGVVKSLPNDGKRRRSFG